MVLLLAGRLIQFLIAFLSVKIMTTLLPPVEVGKITLVTTATAFFALFLLNPVGMFINRRLHVWAISGFIRQYFYYFCIYLFTVASFAALVSWAMIRGELLDVGLSPMWCATLIGCTLLFSTINQVLVPSMNMLERVWPFVILTIGTLSFGLCLSVLLVQYFGGNAVAWLAGPILSQLAFSFIAFKVFFRDQPSIYRPLGITDYRRLLNFAWPISVAVGLNWLHMQGYRFILADKFGLAELGLFSAGYGLAASLTAAGESVGNTWFQPRFYQEANSTDALIREGAWNRYANNMLPFTILVSSGIFIAAPYLNNIMLGPSYHASVMYLMAGALAEWGRTLFNIFALDAHASMNTRRLIMPSLVGLIIAYSVMLIPIWIGLLVAVPLAVLMGCVVISGIIRHRASKKKHWIDINWLRVAKISVQIALASTLFELCQPEILIIFGRLELYASLFILLVIWSGIFWISFRPNFLLTVTSR